MQKIVIESADLSTRHALDGLSPTSAVEVALAASGQLGQLADMANREIPGVAVTEADLVQFLRDDPESIFIFQRGGRLLGGVAFLYLNDRGFDALVLDDIDLKRPRRDFLARAEEDVAAIYTWALAGHGRAVLGLGNVAAYLRKPRFIAADYYAQPSTAAGRDLLVALGFKPTPSFQPDLWCFQRSRHIDARPVSYTHLDVYKRQALHHGRF